MSQTPYEYVRISEGLLQRMTGLLRQGNSFGLLGPRNAGKQYVLRRLCDLCRPFAATIGVVPFLTARAEEGVRSDCDQDMYLSSATLLPSGVAATLRWTDDRLGETGPGRPVVLLVANADTLPYESMVRLLEGLRERAGRAGSAGRLAAVLTGELVLRRYLRQQEAGRWWDVCFTLLGYERPEFEAFARRYVATLGLTVDVGEGVWDDLYERAGGSVYVLRLLLWTAFDRWASEEGRELRLSDLPDRVGAGQVPWNHYLRYLTRVITLDSKTWARLEVLIRGGTVEAVDHGPDDLELAGLAVRDGGVLRLGWTVLHQSLGNYFTPRRFADLYAGGGWWRKAFGRYRDLGPRERIWPSALDDVADAENAVKDLCMSLYQVAATPKDPVPASQAAPGEATAPSRPESPEETLTADEAAVEGAARVCRRFVNGCLYVLGFPEVSFWAWREGRWVRTGRSPEGLAEEPEEWYQALLA
ncbi:MAG TPA: hypothetical protein VKD72_23280, partial [Gemmataceae bacterium]|nr:hypothetical protein [Gemmataceae bacterium]